MKPIDILSKTRMFSGLDKKSLSEYAAPVRVKTFSKGEIVAAEGDTCSCAAIVEKGEIAMQQYTSGGEYTTIGLLLPGEYLGEDLLFGRRQQYAYTYEAMSQTEVLFIPRDVLISIMEAHPEVKDNYLCLLSDTMYSLNRRIAILSQKTIRQKIALYVLDLRAEQEMRMSVVFPGSREVIAKLLAMPRPSFSRELTAMEKEGILEVSGRTVEILDLVRLEKNIAEGEPETKEEERT